MVNDLGISPPVSHSESWQLRPRARRSTGNLNGITVWELEQPPSASDDASYTVFTWQAVIGQKSNCIHSFDVIALGTPSVRQRTYGHLSQC